MNIPVIVAAAVSKLSGTPTHIKTERGVGDGKCSYLQVSLQKAPLIAGAYDAVVRITPSPFEETDRVFEPLIRADFRFPGKTPSSIADLFVLKGVMYGIPLQTPLENPANSFTLRYHSSQYASSVTTAQAIRGGESIGGKK